MVLAADQALASAFRQQGVTKSVTRVAESVRSSGTLKQWVQFVKLSSRDPNRKRKPALAPHLAVVLTLAAVALLLFPACNPSSPSANLNEPAYYQVPWPAGQKGYQLKKVRIESFNSPQSLQGKFVQVMVDPFVENGLLKSATPVGRFIKNHEGTVVPADYVSLQASTIHAHYERLQRIDQIVGVAKTLRYPLKIGIRANVVDQRGPVKNNAVFDHKLNALLIVPYVKNQLPIALNGGILAHEHFHKIFQTVVLDRLMSNQATNLGGSGLSGLCAWSHSPAIASDSSKDKAAGFRAIDTFYDESIEVPSEVFNSFLIRGINEGLADFWGWVYTGDPAFIQHSLPNEGIARRLDSKLISSRIHSTVSIKGLLRDYQQQDPHKPGELLPEALRYQRAYEVGTRYARVLRELTLTLSNSAESEIEDRLTLARVVSESLNDLAKAALTASSEKAYLSPNAILKFISLRLLDAIDLAGAGSATKSASGSAADIKATKLSVCRVISQAAAEEQNGLQEQICSIESGEPAREGGQ